MLLPDEFPHRGVDSLPPLFTGEYPVVAHTLGEEVLLDDHPGTQFMGREGLAHARDIILGTLDDEKFTILNIPRFHGYPTDHHLPLREGELVEYLTHRFQVELLIHIENGIVLIVEFLVFRNGILVLLPHIVPVAGVRLEVGFRVHGYEGEQLKESWVYPSPLPSVTCRNGVNKVPREPGDGFLKGVLTHIRGGFPRINGAGHQGKGGGYLLSCARHEGDGGENGNGGLAHGENMDGITPKDLNELPHVTGIGIQPEGTRGEGNIPGVLPIRNVHVVIGAHRSHGVPKKGGEVAGEWGHDQHRGLGRNLL